MVSAPKPTLHEIAAMPFPASLNAMREHYNKDWGKCVPEGVTAPVSFRVTGQYEITTSGRFSVEVDAFTEDEAEDAARDEVDRLYNDDGGDLEIYSVNVKEAEE